MMLSPLFELVSVLVRARLLQQVLSCCKGTLRLRRSLRLEGGIQSI